MPDNDKVFVDHDYTTVIANMILSEARYVNSSKCNDVNGVPVAPSFEHVFREAASRVALAMDLAREYIEARK